MKEEETVVENRVLPKTENEKRRHSCVLGHLRDLVLSPEDTVVMEIFRGVKPEAISLFSANTCASIAINIGLNSPVFASDVPQKLEVQFIMGLLIHVPI